MIRLHPTTEATHECPYCRAPLQVHGWYVPGMRNLADLRCATCTREFYGDLRAGQAIYTPMLLEKATGEVHDAYGVEWFARWLGDSYARRTSEPLRLDVEALRPISKPVVLLNCLDTLYGHCLLKLINAQHYLECRADADLILLIPSFLRWMTPDGAAEIWALDLPLSRGTEWNDWLARELQRRVEAFAEVSLGDALSHPHPDDYRIERFTRVEPFPLDEWASRMERPRVTFIWREDRLWREDTLGQELNAGAYAPRRADRLKRWFASAPAAPTAPTALSSIAEQQQSVVALAESLRAEWPRLDFAVAGVGARGGLPEWMMDMRETKIDDATERAWCERYAASHAVVGLHGSNMLLPSAHAGSVVELIPPERWGNFTQDILFRPADARDTLFRHRFLPESTTPHALAQLLNSILRGYPGFRQLMDTKRR